MTQRKNCHYEATIGISPMYDGQEMKDQDRAVWSPTALTACLCDGVTSSPFSAEAAALTCTYSRVLFRGDTPKRLSALCELLLALRADKLRSGIALSPDNPQTMHAILRDAAHQNLLHSFQTTLVAAHIAPAEEVVACPVIRCGDSIFLAFGADGELLVSCASTTATNPRIADQRLNNGTCGPSARRLDFGPGDEILAKIRCEASKYPDLAQASGISPEHRGNWLLCEVLDKCTGTSRKTPEKSEVLHVERGDLLMVPRYLAGSVIRVRSRSYTRLLYSRTIRPAHTRARPVDFP